MKNYELLCILPGTYTDDEAEKMISEIKETVGKHNGQKLNSENLGKSRLAYPIKHIRYGYFINFYFEAEKEDIVKLQKTLKINTSLLRAMINKYNPIKREEKNNRIKNLVLNKENEEEKTITAEHVSATETPKIAAVEIKATEPEISVEVKPTEKPKEKIETEEMKTEEKKEEKAKKETKKKAANKEFDVDAALDKILGDTLKDV